MDNILISGKKCDVDLFEIESPQHDITIGGFWIDSTEVTNALYQLCVDSSRCKLSRLANDTRYNSPDYLVAVISWQDATDYCVWTGLRLPTEAEWEFAAKGTNTSLFPWGDEFECDGGNLFDASTGCNDSFPGPSPVGSFPAFARPSYRYPVPPEADYLAVGFRCVVSREEDVNR